MGKIRKQLKCSRGIISCIGNGTGTALEKSIDYLPVEFHLPGYQYCGPGTKLD